MRKKSQFYPDSFESLIVTDDGDMCAYSFCYVDKHTSTAFVEPVSTREKYRKKGLCKQMLHGLIIRLKEMGIERAYINSYDWRKKVYNSAGFETEDSISFWYKKRKSQLWYVGYVIVLLVAFSRNYLGVHTLIDVVASIVLSSIFYIILFDLMEWSRKYLGRKLLLALLLIVILGILVGVFGPLSNIGAGFGIVTGYIMEALFVKFKPKGSIGIRIIRFFIGACGLLFVMYCLFISSLFKYLYNSHTIGCLFTLP